MKKLFLLLLLTGVLTACSSYEAPIQEMQTQGRHYFFTEEVHGEYAIELLTKNAPNLYEHSFAVVNLGADSVYVGNHHILIPHNIDVGLIANVNIIYMGALHDVLSLGFWNCKTEIEKLMRLWLPIDSICTFLVFEFLSSAEELIGHSISISPIWNANTHECYAIEFVEIATHYI